MNNRHKATGEVSAAAIDTMTGLTEGGPVLTTNTTSGPPKPGSVGRALPGIEAQPFAELREDVDSALASASRKLARREERSR